MRFFILCASALVVVGLPAQPLPQATHDRCDRRIHELEQRLARVESALERLTGGAEDRIMSSALIPPAAAQTAKADVLPPRFRGLAAPPAKPGAPLSSPFMAPPPSQGTQSDSPPSTSRSAFEMPPELVPQIGKIGAEVGLLLSGATSPFRLGTGQFFGGFIDLPLFEPVLLRGKISYEISVGMSQSKTTFTTTSNVAQVANLAVLNTLNPNGGLGNVAAAVSGTGAAPFPVKTSNLTRLRLLQVIPFSFKYTSTAFDRWRIRPYGLIGFGTFVTIHSQNPARGTPPTFGVRPDANVPPEILGAVNSLFGGQAPFGGPLVAGQISQAPELEARGLPGGHGNLDFGLQTAVGVEVRLNRNFSLGFDARFNKIAGTYGSFRTVGSRLGFHF